MIENLINQAVEYVANIDYTTYALKAAFWVVEQGVEIVKWTLK